MRAPRIDMHRLQELVRLHRQGTGAREVARLLGMSPNTEREYREALVAGGLLAGPVEDLPPLEALKAAIPRRLPPQQTSTAEPWADEVRRLTKKGVRPRAIYDHLRTNRADFAVRNRIGMSRERSRWFHPNRKHRAATRVILGNDPRNFRPHARV